MSVVCISKNYVIYKQNKDLSLLKITNNRKVEFEYKKFSLNLNSYKFYFENDIFYIFTKDRILTIDNILEHIEQNNLIIYKIQNFPKILLAKSTIIPLKKTIIHLSKESIQVFKNQRNNWKLVKKLKNNIDIEHIQFCKNKFITISFDDFSKLFLHWYKDLYFSILEKEDLILLLLTFKHWLVQSFTFFYQKTNVSFFRILYIKDNIIYIMGDSKIFIFNYIDRCIEWKVDVSYYLNRYDYDDIKIYGDNDYCYFVIVRKTKYQFFLEYFVLNNVSKSLFSVYNHEYWFADYFFTETTEDIKNIHLCCNEDFHFINYYKNNRSYLHFLFSFKKKCFDTIYFKILQTENLEQNFLKYKKHYNAIMANNIISEEDSKNDIIVNKCCICYENNANLLFLPCSHYCCCKSCSSSLTSCPICRTNILNKRSIFFH